MWCHHPTSFRRGLILLSIVLATLIVALITTLLFVSASHAAPSTTKTINFEGRLLTAAGAVVPDGNYNVQFKIYQGGAGTAAGNPGGTLQWTETYANNSGNSGVEVKNGFLSVSLGSKTPFGSSVDWNDDTLWLSMNVAGAAGSCATFGSAPCAADGEMLPMKRITATPYAINAGAINGKTSDNFVQLGQGVQGDPTNASSIFINKTGTGNLVQLQNSATDIFTIGNTGNITLGGGTDKTISVSVADADTAGNALSIVAGNGGAGAGASGGNLVLQGGSAGGTDGDGGNVQIDAGAKTGTGSVGSISIGSANAGSITIGSTSNAATQNISLGNNNTSGSTSNIIIGAGGSAAGGSTSLQSKDDTTVSTNGTQRARFSGSSDTLYVGNADEAGNAPAANAFTIQGTSSTGSDVQGGGINIKSGSATNGNANGGNVTVSGGSGSGTGADGLVVISTPTFQTAAQEDFAANGTASKTNIDGNGVVILNATEEDLVITLPDPTITMAGRVIYVTVPSGSEAFTLAINGGGTNNEINLKEKTTATMLWNGSDWTVAGATSSTSLQDIYNKAIDGNSNVRIGSETDGTTTLFTVDKGASAPLVTDEALLGSMYYDTTIGALQCYEATGWGSCSASPDNFVTLSPEYSGAVINGSGTGTMTTDLCSDDLNINDGTSGQPTICASKETFNFYNWKSADPTAQTRSIYVTYQLPSTFKQFVAGSTSLTGFTDSTNSVVSYQAYRNNPTSGLTACGSVINVSTGAQSAWQKATATSTSDPSTCSFAAGDSIVFKVNLTASNDANAFASNLSFAFSNN